MEKSKQDCCCPLDRVDRTFMKPHDLVFTDQALAMDERPFRVDLQGLISRPTPFVRQRSGARSRLPLPSAC
jgi:hypothetical protein